MVARPDEQYNNQDIEFLKHLASDFGGLLNRVDISDCFLRVRGNGSLREIDRSIFCSSGVYMAVHRCVLAARSNTFAGKTSLIRDFS